MDYSVNLMSNNFLITMKNPQNINALIRNEFRSKYFYKKEKFYDFKDIVQKGKLSNKQQFEIVAGFRYSMTKPKLVGDSFQSTITISLRFFTIDFFRNPIQLEKLPIEEHQLLKSHINITADQCYEKIQNYIQTLDNLLYYQVKINKESIKYNGAILPIPTITPSNKDEPFVNTESEPIKWSIINLESDVEIFNDLENVKMKISQRAKKYGLDLSEENCLHCKTNENLSPQMNEVIRSLLDEYEIELVVILLSKGFQTIPFYFICFLNFNYFRIQNSNKSRFKQILFIYRESIQN